jgi:hypothetical protein
MKKLIIMIFFFILFNILNSQNRTIEYTTQNNTWQAIQPNGIWGPTLNSNYSSGFCGWLLDCNNTGVGLPGTNQTNGIWGNNLGTRNIVAACKNYTANIVRLRLIETLNLTPCEKIDSVVVNVICDDLLDTIYINNQIAYQRPNPMPCVFPRDFTITNPANFFNSNNFTLEAVCGNDGTTPYGFTMRMRVFVSSKNINSSIIATSDTACIGDSVILTAKPAGLIYSWNTSPLQTLNSIIVKTSGNYSVIVSDSLGCSDTSSKNITFENCCPQDCFWTLNGNNNVLPTNFIGPKNNADFKIRTNNIERAIVKADGKIGVGTSTPTEQLHSTQGVRFEGLSKLDSPKRIVVQDNTGKLYWSDALSFKGPKGDKGDQGSQGPKGDQGPVGPTPVISNLLEFSNPNKITSTVNGVSSSTITVGAVSNTSRGNQFSTTVNGVVGSSVNIINSNALTLNGSFLTSTVNGIVSNSITLPSATGNFWNLGGNTNITSTNNIIGITNANSNPLRFFTNNSEKMTILSNGNIGVGTTSPSNSQGWGRVLDVFNSNHSKIISSNSLVKTGLYSHDNLGGWGGLNGAWGLIGTETNHGVAFISNYSPRMVILNTGNIGIGTVTPNNKLEISHGTANNSGLRFTNLTNSSSSILNSTNKVLSVNASGDVILVDDKQGTGNTTNSCNVNGSIPRLNGTNSYTCSQVFDNGTSVGVGAISGFTYSSYSGATIGSNVPLSSGNVKLEVNGVLRSTMSIVTSDGKLKTDVKDLKEALSIVKSLKGKTYNWSSEFQKKSGVDNGRHIGFIAQEIREVLPELVIEDENKQLGVNYTELIPVLVEAIKDQQNQIDDLKSGNKISSIAPSSTVDIDAMNKEMNQLKSENQMFKEKFELLEKSISLLCESGCAGLEKAKQNAEDADVLYQSIPNPTDSEALINFYLSKKYNNASIQINSLEGKSMETIVLDASQGKGSVKIQLGQYAAQTYFYSLIVDNKVVDTKKLTVIR